MKSRLIASIALCAAVILGTTGCNVLSTQATRIGYSPSDGVNVPASGPLEVRNALVVTNEEGTDGNFVAAIVNTTDSRLTLNIEFGESHTPASVHVPAHSTVSLGSGGTDPLLLEGTNTPAGATIPIFFQSGDAEGVIAQVPVLDGTLPYLADLAP